MLVNNYQYMLRNNTEDQRPFHQILHQQAVWAKDDTGAKHGNRNKDYYFVGS